MNPIDLSPILAAVILAAYIEAFRRVVKWA